MSEETQAKSSAAPAKAAATEAENASATPETDAEEIKSFSVQPTSMVETTFAETIGLSMHNAILTQQNSQMIAQASITNACARLLTVPSAIKIKKAKAESEDDASGANDEENGAIIEGETADGSEENNKEKQNQPKRLSISNFFKSKKNKEKEQESARNEPKVNSVLDLGTSPSKKTQKKSGTGDGDKQNVESDKDGDGSES